MPLRAGLAPLAERPFRVLFLGRFASLLGSTMAPVALAFAVLDLNGSPVDLGVVLAANVLPQVLLLLVGGVLADRLPRGRLMVGSNVVSAAGQAATATFLLTGRPPVWGLAALAVVTGAASAFFGPASQGVLPQTVPAEQLHQANALLRLSLNMVRVLGPAVGGVLVAIIGSGWVIGWDAATFAIAAAVLTRLRLAGPPRRGESFLILLRTGWVEFWSRTWVWAIVLQYSIVNLVWVGGFQLLGPTVADHSLGGPTTWGLITSALAAGLLIGAAAMLWWQPTRPLLAGAFGTVCKVAPLIGLATRQPVWILMALTGLAGFGVEVVVVSFTTAMQAHIPLDRLSRVSSYDMLFGVALMPLGYLIAGPLSVAVGIDTTLWAGAAVIAASTALILGSAEVRGMRRVRDSAPAGARTPASTAAR
jgi:MFS family permease